MKSLNLKPIPRNISHEQKRWKLATAAGNARLGCELGDFHHPRNLPGLRVRGSSMFWLPQTVMASGMAASIA
jgi:hypothetical protein